MADVLITPGSGIVEFKSAVGGTEIADINIDTNNLNLVVGGSNDIYASGAFRVQGTITAANIGAGVDNSVVILDSDGTFRTDEIDSRVWGSTLADDTDLATKQNTITGAATTIVSSNLTANRAVISNGSGKIDVSPVTSTELSYLDGVTSSIQTQINSKTSCTGTVTSVAAGNGLNFTTITGAGSVTLGTPGSTTLVSTNAVTATSHTHAFAPGGTTAQYIRGDGTLATFPTSLVDGGGTTNQITYWVDSNTVGALATATYPSLTELSYVKGVTSAIQTQINSKTSCTGTVTGTGTANQLSYWTSASNQGTLSTATYPSLTELSYVKGVTSAIQTQINAKTSCTGTVTSVGITAGSLIDVTGGPITGAGSITVNVDLSELATSTTNADGDYFVVVDTANAQRKLTKANINLSEFNNNSGWTSCTGTVTGTGSASTITYWNGTGSIASLSTATYPSLTELSYVKGVTSSIQTQLNTKTTCTGTVTSVAAGNGLNFSTITGAGSVTLGTPGSTTLASTNAVTATSHTHAFAPGGSTSQYIRGDGSLASFPTIASDIYQFGGTGGIIPASGSNTGGTWSVVSGGCINTASAKYSVIAGGACNTASGYYGYSTVGGGRGNTASGDCSTVSGGLSNTASSYFSTVGGGKSNTANANTSTVSGGYGNSACEYASAVGGGFCNTASGYISTVGGGCRNTANGFISTVGGGKSNTACGACSVVTGGQCNFASGNFSSVSGGKTNTASGCYSSIAGGKSNTDSGCCNVHILGSNITATAPNTTFTENLHVTCALKIDSFDPSNLSTATCFDDTDYVIGVIRPTGVDVATESVTGNTLRSTLLSQAATLQFRRGTDVDRQGITPAEGEPIWATDTCELWVGDGTTPGGIAAGGQNSVLVRGSCAGSIIPSGGSVLNNSGNYVDSVILAGNNNKNPSIAGLMMGYCNTGSFGFSNITIGKLNTNCNDCYSTVIGSSNLSGFGAYQWTNGTNNNNISQYATIVNGSGNFAVFLACYQFIGGGKANCACANYTSVINGHDNSANHSGVFILGHGITSSAANTTYVESLDVLGTIDAPNLGAGVDNSVVILDSDGKLRTDEIDSRVWGSTLADDTDLAGKQNTITGAATTITSTNLTTNRAVISNGSGKVDVSAVTSTELGYLDGVTSNVQTQLNAKTTCTGTVTSVSAGNGLDFTTITGAGSVTLGTPGSTTLSSTNSVSATSHTHAFNPGGTSAQYIRGDGTLATYDAGGGGGGGVYEYDGTGGIIPVSGSNTGGAWSVVGGGCSNTASGSCSVINGGSSNHTTAVHSVVAGGSTNWASGIASTVGGGCYNLATVNCSTIAGGASNCATTLASTIGGGLQNKAISGYTYVGGGYQNTSSGPWGAIAGGRGNCATLSYAFVGAGYLNCSGGVCSTVSGGYCNKAAGSWTTVAGGHTNHASGNFAFVGGGCANVVTGCRSAIGGGQSNSVSTDNSTIGGGCANCVSGLSGTVGGGDNNSVLSGAATIGGGSFNCAAGLISTVGGGQNNTASGYYSTISGGQGNCTFSSAYWSTIGGGCNNTTSAYYSTVSGGYHNAACGQFATVGGGVSNVVTGAGSVIAGGGYYADFDLSYANCIAGKGSFVGGGGGNTICSTACSSVIVGGHTNFAIGNLSSVLGGTGNCACGFNSISLGSSTVANSMFGIAMGNQGRTVLDGEVSIGGWSSGGSGKHQHRMVNLTRYSNSAATGSLGIGGSSTCRLTIPACSIMMFDAKVSAYNGTGNGGAWWCYHGAIQRDGSNTTTMVGPLVVSSGVHANFGLHSLTVTPDDTNEALDFAFTSANSNLIYVTAVVDASWTGATALN